MSRSGFNDVALSYKLMVAFIQRCLILSLVEIGRSVLENVMFLKDANVLKLFCYYLPLQKFEET